MREAARGLTPAARPRPHGDLAAASLPPPLSPGDFARIWMRGTSAAALPQLPLLASRANGTLRRGVLEAEARVGVRLLLLLLLACCCRRSSSLRVAGEAKRALTSLTPHQPSSRERVAEVGRDRMPCPADDRWGGGEAAKAESRGLESST